MINSKIEGAKDSLLNSCMYYRQALLQAGCTDVNKEISTEIGKGLILTDEQIQFLASSENKLKVKEILSSIDLLLKAMVFNNKLDKESIGLVVKGISSLKELLYA